MKNHIRSLTILAILAVVFSVCAYGLAVRSVFQEGPEAALSSHIMYILESVDDPQAVVKCMYKFNAGKYQVYVNFRSARTIDDKIYILCYVKSGSMVAQFQVTIFSDKTFKMYPVLSRKEKAAAENLYKLYENPRYANVYLAASHFLGRGTPGVDGVLQKVLHDDREQEEFLGEFVEAYGVEKNVKYSRVIEMNYEGMRWEVDFVLEVNRQKYPENSLGGYELEDGIYLCESKTEPRDFSLEEIIEITKRMKLNPYREMCIKLRKEGVPIKGIIFAYGGEMVPANEIYRFFAYEEEPDEAENLLHLGLYHMFVPDSVIERGKEDITAKEKEFSRNLIRDFVKRKVIEEGREEESLRILNYSLRYMSINQVRHFFNESYKRLGASYNKMPSAEEYTKIFADLESYATGIRVGVRTQPVKSSFDGAERRPVSSDDRMYFMQKPLDIHFFRIPQDTEETVSGLLGGLFSKSFSREKFVIMLDNSIGQPNPKEVLGFFEELNKLKKYSPYADILKNIEIVIDSKDNLRKKLFEEQYADKEVLLFASLLNSSGFDGVPETVKKVFIDETGLGEYDYRPIVELMSLMLAELMEKGTLDSTGSYLESINVKKEISSDTGAVIFTLLPPVEKFDREDFLRSYGELKRILMSV